MTKSQQVLRWISSIIGAVSCWWMAYAIFQAHRSGQEQVFGIPIVAIILVEFILVHAASIPMIAASKESRSAKIVAILLVSAIYIAFITGITVMFHSTQLLLTFAGIMIPRWTGLFTDSDAARQQQIDRSLESGLSFVLTIIPCLLLFNNAYAQALMIYFVLMGLLEGTSPLRKQGLDKSRRVGCFVTAYMFIVIIVCIGSTVVEMIWGAWGAFRSFFHK